MSKVIMVSNRLPLQVNVTEDGFEYVDTVGGLSTGMKSFIKEENLLWIGWPGITREQLTKRQMNKIKRDLGNRSIFPVFLSNQELNHFYYGFCNNAIWPLFHYFPLYANFDPDDWQSYNLANQHFFKALKEVYRPGDIIWVHDYHLMLLPKLVREGLTDPTLGFFLHIPFPSYEVFRLFPWREEILEGLVSADLVGFHTYDYVTHFLKCIHRILGLDHKFGRVDPGNHTCFVNAFPMGIDYERYNNPPSNGGIRKEIERIKRKIGDRKIILSIDRLDYSKGILHRLDSFDYFLRNYPSFHEKVTLILVAVPSRQKVNQYEELKKRLDEKVGNIEGKFGSIGWTPIWYIYRALPFSTLLALYKTADICLVTPLRDGMNLIAKEYIASKEDLRGVLILSEMAGAAHEMGEALIINPNNHEAVSAAIRTALTMNEEEMILRNGIMQKRLKRYNVRKWGKAIINQLTAIKASANRFPPKKIGQDVMGRIIKEYQGSARRLVLLDYDGTLSNFKDLPINAYPDKEVLKILKDLSRSPSTTLVIISGRDRMTMDKWFGKIGIGLSAEHGIWWKMVGGEWKLLEPMNNEWKQSINQLLEVYTDRTPGSFVEEKEFSLVWHYRRANPELANIRVNALIGDILDLTTNTDIGVLEGNKVIEVKKTGVNKGTAVMHLLKEKGWDFILAIGDDRTDEEVFKALPPTAYTIKVGTGQTSANFNIDSVDEVRRLLRQIVEGGN